METETRNSVMAFWLGIVLIILSLSISFSPGSEAYWFGFTSILVGAGLFAKENKYRIAAAILLVFCLAAAYNGYVHGLEYQEFLRTRPNQAYSP